jgi:hypothetical protein
MASSQSEQRSHFQDIEYLIFFFCRNYLGPKAIEKVTS